MGKSSRFFKTYINIDTEKYVFLLLFPWKIIAFQSLREITKCFRGQQKETTLYMTNCRFNCLKIRTCILVLVVPQDTIASNATSLQHISHNFFFVITLPIEKK